MLIIRFKYFKPYLGSAVLVVALAIILTACSSTSSPAAPAASLPPSNTSAPTAGPDQSNPNRPFLGQGAEGTLARIDENALTLNTQQGTTTTVNMDSNTAILKMSAIATGDLQTGQFLTVVGTADASGSITARTIEVMNPGQNPRFMPPTGDVSTPTGRILPTDTNFPRSGNLLGNSAFGTLSQVNGNQLTLATGQGQEQVTVIIDQNTVIRKTANGTALDLQVGQSLIIIGTRDSNGNLSAVSITIRPQSTQSSG